MEKIFKVWKKIWLWHSGPLKFAGVGKVFVNLHILENRKCALKLKFLCWINQFAEVSKILVYGPPFKLFRK